MWGGADLRLVISPSDHESGIQGESIPLVFVAGETEQVQVDVLGETDEIAAGDPVRVRLTLLDGNGNLTSRQLAKVRLTEGCGGTLDQEVEIGLCSIAVPLLDSRGRTVAALNLGMAATQDRAAAMVGRYLPEMRRVQAGLARVIG